MGHPPPGQEYRRVIYPWMILTQCHSGNVPHQITTKHMPRPLNLLVLLTYVFTIPATGSLSAIAHYFRTRPVLQYFRPQRPPHLCAIEPLQPCFDRMMIRVMALDEGGLPLPQPVASTHSQESLRMPSQYNAPPEEKQPTICAPVASYNVCHEVEIS